MRKVFSVGVNDLHQNVKISWFVMRNIELFLDLWAYVEALNISCDPFGELFLIFMAHCIHLLKLNCEKEPTTLSS